LWLAAVPVAGAAAAGRPLTKIQRPREDPVGRVRSRVRVVVRSRIRLGSLRISLDGRSITHVFHRSAGAYRATLRNGASATPRRSPIWRPRTSTIRPT
jgi:hypothetical protein